MYNFGLSSSSGIFHVFLYVTSNRIARSQVVSDSDTRGIHGALRRCNKMCFHSVIYWRFHNNQWSIKGYVGLTC